VTWIGRDSTRYWTGVASSANGTKLVACARAGKLLTSSDGGVSWIIRDNVDRQWYGVASSSDGTKLVAAVISGQIYTSTNSGASWTARESARGWGKFASSSDGTKLVTYTCCIGDGDGRIYTSTNRCV
jgi:hypothetical protein